MHAGTGGIARSYIYKQHGRNVRALTPRALLRGQRHWEHREGWWDAREAHPPQRNLPVRGQDAVNVGPALGQGEGQRSPTAPQVRGEGEQEVDGRLPLPQKPQLPRAHGPERQGQGDMHHEGKQHVEGPLILDALPHLVGGRR